MQHNHLKFAFRNLWRNKFYSLINIGGLAIGIAVSMLILVFVGHELSFDRFHKNIDKIYQLSVNFTFNNQEIRGTGMSAYMGPAMKETIPGVDDYVRLYHISDAEVVIKKDATHLFYESKVVLADPSYFSVFSFPFLAGNPKTALSQPNSMVITEKMARKYFGKTDVIGAHLYINSKLPFTISGILQDIPSNSTLDYEFILPIESFVVIKKLVYNESVEPDYLSTNFIGMGSFTTYYQLSNLNAIQQIPEKIAEFWRKDKLSESEIQSKKFELNPLKDLHLQQGRQVLIAGFNKIYLLSLIAIVIMLVALFNYVGITTARASERAKEVGVKKVMGAMKGELMRQFYLESIVVTSLAFGLGLLLSLLMQNLFFEQLGISIDASFIFSRQVILPLGFLLMACVLFSGAYPAIILSAFKPTEALKGRIWSGRRGGKVWFKKSITAFQFSASIVLLIAAIVAYQQLDFLQSRSLGFQKEQVVMIRPTQSGFTEFRNGIEKLSAVKGTGIASMSLFKDGTSMAFTKSPINNNEVEVHILEVDRHFFEVLGIKWAHSKQQTNLKLQSNTVVINQEAAKQMGYNSGAGVKDLTLQLFNRELSGVVENFQFDLGSMMKPTALAMWVKNEDLYGTLYVRLASAQHLQADMSAIGQLFKKHCPDKPFEYFFLDESFDALFKAEDRMAKLFGFFTGLAIVISCLGLFGLAAYATARRTKEIGIRKVLGASVSSLMQLLSVEFLRPVLIAIVIASPIAWYAMNQWLQKFTYRIDLEWWVFALAGIGAVVLALLTVSIQSLRTALANPVNAIKNE